MTYDMAGAWDGITGHCTSLTAVKGIYNYFATREISLEKVNMGTIMSATCFYIKDDLNLSHLVGVPIDTSKTFPGGLVTMDLLKEFENQAVSGYKVEYDKEGRAIKGEEFDKGGVGWHFYFDEKAGASYMVNDDPESEYYKWYLSYESPLSLQAKLDFAHKYKMAGIIVWEVSQDDADYPMIHQMDENLK
jgi:chitinase